MHEVQTAVPENSETTADLLMALSCDVSSAADNLVEAEKMQQPLGLQLIQ